MVDFLTDVWQHIAAGYQSLIIDTAEIARAEQTLLQLPDIPAANVDAVLTWDCVNGFILQTVKDGNGKLLNQRVGPDALSPGGVLDWLVKIEQTHELTKLGLNEVVVILRNFQLWMRDNAVYQRWQNYVYGQRFIVPQAGGTTARLPIIIGNAMTAPQSLEDTVARIAFSLPDTEALKAEIDKLETSADLPADRRVPAEGRHRIGRLLLGLTLREASDIGALVLVRHGKFIGEEVPDLIEERKVLRFGNTPGLSYIPKRRIETTAALGGFDAYKQWIEERRICFTEDAAAAGVDIPRGVLLIGPPGTAKSLAGEVTARALGLPLVDLDLGALYGSLVGETEGKIRRALEIVDTMDGCVCRLDEIDKYVAHVTEASGDSGVTQRLFGTLLSWLASKKSRTFVIATANRTTGIPPEMLRRGRFDEIFSTSLPDEQARRQIAEIHLRKRRADPAAVFPTDAAWQPFLTQTKDFVGAEIEQVCADAKLLAFRRGSPNPTPEEMVELAGRMVTCMKMDPDSILKIQQFCKDRTRPVSEDRVVTVPPTAPLSRRGARPVRAAQGE